MVFGGTTTIVNSIIRDNTAYSGGGMYVDSVATVNVYSTTFSSNTVSDSGPDIYNSWSGLITVYGCEAAGWYGGTQGSALNTYGTIGGSPYSFSGYTACAR